jgi:cytidine deaminase
LDISETPGEIQLLVKASREAAKQAYAPYSRFHVGSAVLTEDGRVFTGCNIENASYGLSICAERNAVFSAVSAGERKIRAVAIFVSGDEAAFPCGACRQVLAEFAPQDESVKIYLVSDKGVETHTLAELLPHAFKL